MCENERLRGGGGGVWLGRRRKIKVMSSRISLWRQAADDEIFTIQPLNTIIDLSPHPIDKSLS